MGQFASTSRAARHVAQLSPERLGMTADLLGILSAAFRLPTKTLVDQVTSGQLSADLDKLAGALGLEASCRRDLAPYSGADGAACLHELRSEYTRLFVGAPTPEVWPYEGVRHAVARGSEPLLFVGSVTEDVEKSYRASGFSRKPDAPNEPPDHVAVELEFLAHLAYAAAGGASIANKAAAKEGTADGTTCESPDKASPDAPASFARAHALFFSELADDVAAATTSRFYRTMVNLLSQLAGLL